MERGDYQHHTGKTREGRERFVAIVRGGTSRRAWVIIKLRRNRFFEIVCSDRFVCHDSLVCMCDQTQRVEVVRETYLVYGMIPYPTLPYSTPTDPTIHHTSSQYEPPKNAKYHSAWEITRESSA
eukprot:scaffold5479_cov199-Amphora_coffeaeformis.AAC.40